MVEESYDWTYKTPLVSGFYWYAEHGRMAMSYITYLDKALQYQRQTKAEVHFINGAGYWPKREIEFCEGMWLKIDEPE